MDGSKRMTAQAEENLGRLMEIVARLRSPEGCPWDREQSQRDIARYLLEEAYEVVDAIASGSPAALREELGDLLFQIVFLARLAEEEGDFDLAGVAAGIEEKMIRRHPHVFGDRAVKSVAAVKENWEDIKKKEGKVGATCGEQMAGVIKALPALSRAEKITKVASRVGFDFASGTDCLQKVEEELTELKGALRDRSREQVAEEIGDLIFSLVNLSRLLEVDAEASLRAATDKFVRRFAYVEEELRKRGKKPVEVPLEEMDRLWEEAKLRRELP